MAVLSSKLLVSALVRIAEGLGGGGMILKKGDETAGAVLIQMFEKNRAAGLFERVLGGSGVYAWDKVGPQDVDIVEETDAYILRRTMRDPDLWVVELSVPDAAQFIAERLSQA
jgi:hypothetical protein